MTPHRFALEPLTFPDMKSDELVHTAAAAGFQHVSMTLSQPVSFLPADPVVGDATLQRALIQQMKDAGVSFLNIECFNLTPEAHIPDFRPALACGQALGATSATAIVWENTDRADALRKFQALCDMADEYGIPINLEFFGICDSIPNLDVALDFVRDAKRKNAGLVIDMLHLIRTGSSIAELRALDPALVGWVQLCDSKADAADREARTVEASFERMLPGTGAFPVREFVQSIRTDQAIGLEVPRRSLKDKVSPIDQAREMIAAARALYA